MFPAADLGVLHAALLFWASAGTVGRAWSRRRSAPHAGLGRRPATSSRSACVVGAGRSAPPASLR